jgi:hypothetical protein
VRLIRSTRHSIEQVIEPVRRPSHHEESETAPGRPRERAERNSEQQDHRNG